jgi:hypothetical protein
VTGQAFGIGFSLAKQVNDFDFEKINRFGRGKRRDGFILKASRHFGCALGAVLPRWFVGETHEGRIETRLQMDSAGTFIELLVSPDFFP